MPALDYGPSGGQAPPLADDLGFDSLRLGTPNLGPQRSKSPAPPGSSRFGGMTQGQATAMYAQREMYQSVAEVHPDNSLAAIADQVDEAAAGFEHGNDTASMYSDHGGAGAGAQGQQYRQPRQRQTTAPGDPGGTTRPFSDGASSAYDHQPQQGPSRHSAPADGQQGYPRNYAGSYAGSAEGHGQLGPGFFPPDDGSGTGGYYGGPYGAHPHAGFQPQPPHHPNSYYGNQPPYGAQMYDQNNPYFAAAQGYLGFPEGAYPGFPPGMGPPPDLHRAASSASSLQLGMGMGSGPGTLARAGTQLSMASTGSGGRSKKGQEKIQQSLPFTKEFVEEYRHRMKGDPDPEAQFAFAKYLIEAAKKVNDSRDSAKQARKYRDALLSDSLKLVKRLATTGMGLGKPPFADAQFFLANCFGNGSLGLAVDHEKAYNLYVQASKQNHPAATYRTAVCNEVGAGTRRDHHRAVLFYRKASALGDTAGMYKLGMILLNGLLGQPRNIREAVVWLKRAAGQADEENPHALHELGLLHEKPNSAAVIHDEAYARELFTQAAQLGYAPSQFKLGSAYEYGSLTCPVDPRRSIAWYTKAAGKNDGESELALSGWYLTGSEGVLKQSDSEAYLWARRAATKGIPKAEYAVGYYSEVGIGVKADLDEAKRWYMRAAGEYERERERLLQFAMHCLTRSSPPLLRFSATHSSRKQTSDATTDGAQEDGQQSGQKGRKTDEKGRRIGMCHRLVWTDGWTDERTHKRTNARRLFLPTFFLPTRPSERPSILYPLWALGYPF